MSYDIKIVDKLTGIEFEKFAKGIFRKYWPFQI